MQVKDGFNQGASLMDGRRGNLPDARAESRGPNELSEGTASAVDTAGDTDTDSSPRDVLAEEAAEDTLEGKQQSVTAEEPCEIDLTPHSLLSVLLPAKPPPPRNARIVRLFDLEAAEYDSEPEELPDCPPSKEEAVIGQGRRNAPVVKPFEQHVMRACSVQHACG